MTICTQIAAILSVQAADYAAFLTEERGFSEVTALSSIDGDAAYYYLLVAAEDNGLIVGIGNYEAKPDWASEDTKALRYKSAATDPILDLSNFFTIERSGNYIGLRNAVYDTDLMQTHDNAGYMYVNTYTDKTLDEWSKLKPIRRSGYWIFESGKYPMSSGNWACGYLGPWNKLVKEGEPIALNRRDTEGDEAGHFRLFRIARTQLTTLRFYASVLTAQNGFSEVTNPNQLISSSSQCYLITSAEQPGLFVSMGRYQKKPNWADENTMTLRYRQAGNPVADLSNFFTLEKSNDSIGLRNMVYHTTPMLTHKNADYMYVLPYTESSQSEWCRLIASYQDGYWIFKNAKATTRGYMGPHDKVIKADEAISLNRLNSIYDKPGRYRLWRISRSNLMLLMQTIGNKDGADLTWKITNPSLETGDTIGWSLIGKNADNSALTAQNNSITGRAGNWIMNALQWWVTELTVGQTVSHIPSGEYEVSATVASHKGHPINFSTNGVTTQATGVSETSGIKVKTRVNVGTDGCLRILASSTTDWWTDEATVTDQDRQSFLRLDDVQLTCRQLYLDALSVRLPNNKKTRLIPGQWYYYETSYGTEHHLEGDLSGMVYTTSGTVSVRDGLPAGTPCTSTLALPTGRSYFMATNNYATLVVSPTRDVNEGSFTVAALNVDGLPNKILNTVLNDDGPGSDGTKKISRYLSMKGYDIVGLSEDFNYHGSLISSLMDDYSWGTVRATLSIDDLPWSQLIQGKFRFDTDGLNILWKKNIMNVENESWTQWNSLAETEGNQYVKKGFRHYDLWLAGDAVIDVYVLHMDAGDTDATWSRHEQWKQLADAINNSDHSRSKLIIGDTNSRWTREDIIAHFNQQLSADFTMGDVWVELYRNGIYPTADMSDLYDESTPDNYANYEVVDKIIYINTPAANAVRLMPQSFRIERDYTYGTIDGNDDTTPLGDHRPVVVTFKYYAPGNTVPTTVRHPQHAAPAVRAIYDMQGRRVSKPTKKGIYIINGKKVVMK